MRAMIVSDAPRRHRLAPSLFAAWLLLDVAACAPPPGAPPRPTTTDTAPAAVMRVYRDPKTGAFVEPPPGTAMATAPLAPVSPAALTEEAAPGGGRMVRLRGAFRSHIVGHADAAGTTVSCGTATASP
jgi:hypothetical protein